MSAGIDLGLWLAGQIAGPERAKVIQLCMEYDPQPPFDSGHTSKASAATKAAAAALMGKELASPAQLRAMSALVWRRAVGEAAPAAGGARRVFRSECFRYRRADDNLAYDDRGSGDPVLFIAGRGGAGRTWHLHQVPAFQRAGYRAWRCSRCSERGLSSRFDDAAHPLANPDGADRHQADQADGGEGAGFGNDGQQHELQSSRCRFWL